MKFLFNTFLYDPFYNSLVYLIDIIPGGDIGLAVIILTIVVKLILFPLSASSIRTQIKLKEVDGDLKKIREDYKDNREEMGKKMLELYRENKINPFSGVLLILIQLPIILALYFVFAKAGFPEVNTTILYSFVPKPEMINTLFLGLVDLAANKNIVIALLVGFTQFLQMKLVMSNVNKNKQSEKTEKTPMDEIMEKMQFQMKFVMPIIIATVSFSLVSVVGLYWLVSNLFAIGQEIYLQKRIRNPLKITS